MRERVERECGREWRENVGEGEELERERERERERVCVERRKRDESV